MPTRLHRLLLYLSAFTAGMTTMAVEFAASRLLGNIYGTSNIVWGCIIAMVLAYLTLGYFIGGRWADRSPHMLTFYQLLAWAALTSALIPFIARPALLGAARAIASLDVAGIALWVPLTMVVFIVPLVLLGCVPPFVVRLAIDDPAHSGTAIGRVYAVSTIGSLAGTFGAVLLTIPLVGTSRTFLIFAVILMGLALAGLFSVSRRQAAFSLWMPTVLAVLAVLGRGGPLKPPPDGLTLLYETETPYNLVQVVETHDGNRLMLLNEGIGVHSVYNPDRPVSYTGGVWEYFLCGPYFNQPPYTPERVERIAIIGLAGGTVAQQYTGVYGPIPVDGIEIDPGLVEAGREYFGMTMPNLNVIVEDGRVGLHQLGGGYTMIGIDAYRVPYIPWHLTTVEFFREVQSHLTEDGVVTLNVGRTPINRDLVEAVTATLLQVFPTVHIVDPPNTFNSFVIATNQPTSAQNLLANINALPDDAHPLLRTSLELAYTNLQPTVSSGIVLTDDHAPVEGIVNALVLEYILAGQTGQIQLLGQ